MGTTTYTSAGVIAIGQVVCTSAETILKVKAATTAALNAAGSALGIALSETTGADQSVTVADFGGVSRADMGTNGLPLPQPAGSSRTIVVDGVTATCKWLQQPLYTDYVVGVADTQGNVTIQPHAGVATGGPYLLDVRLFGAVADADGLGGGTDSTPAIQAAIRALDSNKGGVVEVPFGRYRLAGTVVVDRSVIIRGHGQHFDHGGTELVCDVGVTGFRVPGADVVIEHLMITTVPAPPPATYTGTYTPPPPAPPPPLPGTVTVQTPNDFVDGQIIRIPGAAAQSMTLERVVPNIVPGTTHLFTGPEPGSFQGIHAGAYLVLGTAYPNKTRVVDVQPTADPYVVSVQMESAATLPPPVTPPPVTYWPDLFARILSGGGTDTLLVEVNNGSPTAGVAIAHADTAVYVQGNNCHLEHVTAGGPSDRGFEGPGITVNASTGWGNYNANRWTITDVVSHGNRLGFVVIGFDANGGLAMNLKCIGPLWWNVVDTSVAGNTYVGGHLQGAYGALTKQEENQYCAFFGVYHESGTYNSFGGGTNVFGGQMPAHAGGYSFVASTINRLILGGITAAVPLSKMQVDFLTQLGLRFLADDSSAYYTHFRKNGADSSTSDGILTGMYGFFHRGNYSRASLLLTDTNATTLPDLTGTEPTRNAGHAYLARGLFLGNFLADAAPLPAQATARYESYGTAAPTGMSPARVWKRGDIIWNIAPVAGSQMGWICTADGSPTSSGTWKKLPNVQTT